MWQTHDREQLAASRLYMDDPEKKEQNITMSEINPKRLLKGAAPRLIDEWQLAPKLWDAIRFEVDHRGELGQFGGKRSEEHTSELQSLLPISYAVFCLKKKKKKKKKKKIKKKKKKKKNFFFF